MTETRWNIELPDIASGDSVPGVATDDALELKFDGVLGAGVARCISTACCWVEISRQDLIMSIRIPYLPNSSSVSGRHCAGKSSPKIIVRA